MANEPTRRDVCDDEKLTIWHFVCLLWPALTAGQSKRMHCFVYIHAFFTQEQKEDEQKVGKIKS
ncbi:hypothetical protein SMQE30_45820 [Serratia marcescens]|nr:hypothetical protein SMQE30_45820 [Serratia marcescens]